LLVSRVVSSPRRPMSVSGGKVRNGYSEGRNHVIADNVGD
jgi:hypothetical protein